jgi:hypothetical protein
VGVGTQLEGKRQLHLRTTVHFEDLAAEASCKKDTQFIVQRASGAHAFDMLLFAAAALQAASTCCSMAG